MARDNLDALIAATDWSRVTHAYGPADDVPALLQALATGEADERRSAIGKLYGNIFHQGTRYPATVKAVPCLIELARRHGQPDLERILILLNHLAVGYPTYFLESGFDYSSQEIRRYSSQEIRRAWSRNAHSSPRGN